MKLPYRVTIDLGLTASWDDIDYTEMVNRISEVVAQEWKLSPQQEFELEVILGNAFRAGYLAAQSTKNPK